MRKYFLKDNNFLKEIDCEWKAYFLGLMYSDGCVYKNRLIITLKESDKQILESLGRIIHKDKFDIKYKRNSCIFTISNKNLVLDIIKLGCLPNKSLILKFPSFNIVPKHLFHHFIRGYFDGDGSISQYNKTRIGIRFCGTFDFCNGLKDYFEQNYNLYGFILKDKNIYDFCITERYSALDMLNIIYKDSTIFLKRKYDRFIKFTEFVNENPLTSKIKGVCKRKRGNKWFSYIVINKKQISLGYYDDEKDAIIARRNGELKYFGETRIFLDNGK